MTEAALSPPTTEVEGPGGCLNCGHVRQDHDDGQGACGRCSCPGFVEHEAAAGIHQLTSAVTDLAKTRFPDFKGKTSREKVNALEDYMVLTAQVEADLHALKLGCSAELERAEDEWALIQGWETHLPRAGRGNGVTQANVEAAKAICRPDLWETIRRNRRLIGKCNEGVSRMERDSKRCSRIYTFLTGS